MSSVLSAFLPILASLGMVLAQMDPATLMRLVQYVFGAVLGIDTGLFGAWLFLRSKGRSPFARTWSVVDIWFGLQIVIALLFAALIPVTILFAILIPKANLQDISSPTTLLYFVLPSTILQNAIFFGVPAFYIIYRYGTRLRDIGLRLLPRRRDWVAGISLGILALLVSQVLSVGLEALANHYRYIEWVKNALDFEKTNPVAQITTNLSKLGVPGLLLGVLGIGIGAPLGEEMLFRGFAFNALKRRFGLVVGLLVSALLFTLPHTYALGLLPVFMMGLLLAWAYHNTGSLWVSIILHATNNTVSVLMAFFFPSLS